MWVSYAVGTGGEYTFERRWAPGEPPPWSLSSGRPPPQPLSTSTHMEVMQALSTQGLQGVEAGAALPWYPRD